MLLHTFGTGRSWIPSARLDADGASPVCGRFSGSYGLRLIERAHLCFLLGPCQEVRARTYSR
jgi:hypothetical protein